MACYFWSTMCTYLSNIVMIWWVTKYKAFIVCIFLIMINFRKPNIEFDWILGFLWDCLKLVKICEIRDLYVYVRSCLTKRYHHQILISKHKNICNKMEPLAAKIPARWSESSVQAHNNPSYHRITRHTISIRTTINRNFIIYKITTFVVIITWQGMFRLWPSPRLDTR